MLRRPPRTLRLPALLLGLVGCAEPLPDTTATIDLQVYAAACAPDDDAWEFWAEEGAILTLRWEVLCLRSGAEPDWWAVKVSDWNDRADDYWQLWFLDPSVTELRFGQGDLPGVQDDANYSWPSALELVAPRALPPGPYRVEVWSVTSEVVSSTTAEVKVTVLPQDES